MTQHGGYMLRGGDVLRGGLPGPEVGVEEGVVVVGACGRGPEEGERVQRRGQVPLGGRRPHAAAGSVASAGPWDSGSTSESEVEMEASTGEAAAVARAERKRRRTRRHEASIGWGAVPTSCDVMFDS